MISQITASFRAGFARLPRDIQTQVRASYQLFKQNPNHRSLHFKEVAPGLYSARISRGYRTLGRRYEDTIVWFFVGPHDECDRLIGRR